MINQSKYYCAKDISKITGLAMTSVYLRLNNYDVKPDLIENCINGRKKNFYLFETICKFFSLSIVIPIVKKERKPYFEFATEIIESKINANGTD